MIRGPVGTGNDASTGAGAPAESCRRPRSVQSTSGRVRQRSRKQPALEVVQTSYRRRSRPGEVANVYRPIRRPELGTCRRHRSGSLMNWFSVVPMRGPVGLAAFHQKMASFGRYWYGFLRPTQRALRLVVEFRRWGTDHRSRCSTNQSPLANRR